MLLDIRSLHVSLEIRGRQQKPAEKEKYMIFKRNIINRILTEKMIEYIEKGYYIRIDPHSSCYDIELINEKGNTINITEYSLGSPVNQENLDVENEIYKARIKINDPLIHKTQIIDTDIYYTYSKDKNYSIYSNKLEEIKEIAGKIKFRSDHRPFKHYYCQYLKKSHIKGFRKDVRIIKVKFGYNEKHLNCNYYNKNNKMINAYYNTGEKAYLGYDVEKLLKV